MSRHGYREYDSCDSMEEQLAYGRWRGQVASVLRSKRGQTFMRKLVAALDALPDRRLCAQALVRDDGACCALGAVAMVEGMDTSDLAPEDYREVASAFGVHEILAQEVMWENDEHVKAPTPYWIRPPRWRAPHGMWERVEEWQDPSDHGLWEHAIGPMEFDPGLQYVPQAAHVEDSERRRWQHMRDWAQRWLRDDGMSAL